MSEQRMRLFDDLARVVFGAFLDCNGAGRVGAVDGDDGEEKRAVAVGLEELGGVGDGLAQGFGLVGMGLAVPDLSQFLDGVAAPGAVFLQ